MKLAQVGNVEVLAKMQRELAVLGNPSAAVHDKIKNEGSSEGATWAHLAAEVQKVGYTRVFPETLEVFGKKCIHVDLKETMVNGVIAALVERYAEKAHFEGEKLEKTFKRVGFTFVLAQRTSADAISRVKKAFVPIFEGHGVPVLDYLKLTAEDLETPEIRAIRHPDLAGKTAEEQIAILKAADYVNLKTKHEHGVTTIPFRRSDPLIEGKKLYREVSFKIEMSEADRAKARSQRESDKTSNRANRIAAQPAKGKGGSTDPHGSGKNDKKNSKKK